MPTKLDVVKAELQVEAGFPQPEFGMLRDAGSLVQHLFVRLEPHGLRLNDLRIERGGGSVGDYHVLCYLFNYWMTIRIRIERIEIVCAEMPKDHVEKFKAAILDVFRAVQDWHPQLAFRAFVVSVGLHARLENYPARDFLSRLAAHSPQGLGPSTGNGAVYYFGPEGDRLLSTITADMSAVAQEAVYLRINGVWDAKKVTADSLANIVEAFVGKALESLELQLPV